MQERFIAMSKKRKIYDDDFQEQALELLLSSGRPIKHVATELGISAKTLRRWLHHPKIKTYKTEGASINSKDFNEMSPVELAKQLHELKKEKASLQRQCEILKIANSMLQKDPPKNKI